MKKYKSVSRGMGIPEGNANKKHKETEKEKISKWFLTEIVGEHLFFLLSAFIEWDARNELEKKVNDLIKFAIEHLKVS